MSISDELRKMSEIDRFRAKPDPRKIFASGNSPFNVDSKYVLQGVQHWSVVFGNAKKHRKQMLFCEHMGLFSRKHNTFWYSCPNFSKN